MYQLSFLQYDFLEYRSSASLKMALVLLVLTQVGELSHVVQ